MVFTEAGSKGLTPGITKPPPQFGNATNYSNNANFMLTNNQIQPPMSMSHLNPIHPPRQFTSPYPYGMYPIPQMLYSTPPPPMLSSEMAQNYGLINHPSIFPPANYQMQYPIVNNSPQSMGMVYPQTPLSSRNSTPRYDDRNRQMEHLNIPYPESNTFSHPYEHSPYKDATKCLTPRKLEPNSNTLSQGPSGISLDQMREYVSNKLIP